MCGILAYIQPTSVKGIDANRAQALEQAFLSIQHRGPSSTNTLLQSCGTYDIFLGFHRRSTVENNSEQANQPLDERDCYLIANANIYDYFTDKMYLEKGDSALLTHSYRRTVKDGLFGEGLGRTQLVQWLNGIDGVFSFILIDYRKKVLIAARDGFGVRPLFVGSSASGSDASSASHDDVCFASEPQAIVSATHSARAVLPGTCHIVDLVSGQRMVHTFFHTVYSTIPTCYMIPRHMYELEAMKQQVRALLIEAVRKRVLMSDVDVGFMCDGGVGSSLMLCIAKRLFLTDAPTDVFTMCTKDSVNKLHAVRQLSSWCQTQGMQCNFHLVNFDMNQGLQLVPKVIALLGTYDVRTIRQAVPQYLLALYINQRTTSKVIISSAGANACFQGHPYFKLAPTSTDAWSESLRLLRELWLYDVLSVERVTSNFGLEVRLPLLDQAFVKGTLMLEPDVLVPRHKDGRPCTNMTDVSTVELCVEKALLWELFHDMLPRMDPAGAAETADGGWAKTIESYCDAAISNSIMENAVFLFPHNTPQTKEAMWYRMEYQKTRVCKALAVPPIPHMWKPNKEWLDANRGTELSAATM